MAAVIGLDDDKIEAFALKLPMTQDLLLKLSITTHQASW